MSLLLIVLSVGNAQETQDPYLTLQIETDQGWFQCLAVATDIGVLTADHCVEDATALLLLDPSGRAWEAELVNVFRRVALLSSDVPIRRLGVGAVVHGESLAAWTQEGWVSGTAYSFPEDALTPRTLATDFPAAPGDSGGPVLNGQGHVVALIVGSSYFGNTLLEPIPVELRAIAGEVFDVAGGGEGAGN